MIDHATLTHHQRQAEHAAWNVGYTSARLSGAPESEARKQGDEAVARVRKALRVTKPGNFLRRLFR